jgi:hypothetical protein
MGGLPELAVPFKTIVQPLPGISLVCSTAGCRCHCLRWSHCLALFAFDDAVGNSREVRQKHFQHTLRNNYAALPRSSSARRYRPTKGCFSDPPRTHLKFLVGEIQPLTARVFFGFPRYRPEGLEEASLLSSTFTQSSQRGQLLKRALADSRPSTSPGRTRLLLRSLLPSSEYSPLATQSITRVRTTFAPLLSYSLT